MQVQERRCDRRAQKCILQKQLPLWKALRGTIFQKWVRVMMVEHDVMGFVIIMDSRDMLVPTVDRGDHFYQRYAF
jgi:hypothetical protein